jgi:LPS sulfotransferase NodH
VQLSLSYLICCCERTGSTLLEEALTATGLAGRPRSYFNRAAHFNPRMQRLLKGAQDDDKYLDRVIAAATTPNGVFGAKVHWAHFLNLVEKTQAPPDGRGPESITARLAKRLPDLRYVHLVRKNKVARAISHYRAKKTDRWQADSAIGDGGDGDPDFDFDQIEAFVRAGEAEDAAWLGFYSAHQIEPLTLIYEDMVVDLASTVRGVLAFLGLSAEGIELPPPRLHRQGDARSMEWEERYRRLFAEENAESTRPGRGAL